MSHVYLYKRTCYELLITQKYEHDISNNYLDLFTLPRVTLHKMYKISNYVFMFMSLYLEILLQGARVLG